LAHPFQEEEVVDDQLDLNVRFLHLYLDYWLGCYWHKDGIQP
jgi:hypothetical protein